MSNARSSPCASPRNVIPPIITNDRDRVFLRNVNDNIDRELSKIDSNVPEQRYIVHKAAFDQIMDHVTAYKPILTAIKAEYEDCIETILRGQREAFYLSGKLKAMANEPSTIRNYKKRGDDLEQKLSVINTDNDKLREHLQVLREAREEKERLAKEIAEPPMKMIKKDNRPIPGLTLQQSTDADILRKELEKLEKQYRELCVSHRTRYTKKDNKENLKSVLSEKVMLRDELAELGEIMKEKRQKLKIAVEAAQAYLRIQPPNQTIGDAVVMALARANKETTMEKFGEDTIARATPSTTFEDDDPSREKEAEMMLEYIEKFNELLEDLKYEAAAIHAANSPKGILRTPETLARFKDLKGVTTGSGRNALLAFCDALMSTVLAFGVRPSEYMSLECVKCALEENRTDLLLHWISQNRLTVTEDLGHMIYNYSIYKAESDVRNCLALAQKVFIDTDAIVPAMICMVKQGRVTQALEYGRNNEAVKDDYIQLVRECPTPQLAHALYDIGEDRVSYLLPLGVIVTSLTASGAALVGLQLIKDTHTHSRKEGGGSSALREAVFQDDVTSSSQWLDIVQKCQDNGYDDVVIEILAAVTVRDAVHGATQYTHMIQQEEAGDKLDQDKALWNADRDYASDQLSPGSDQDEDDKGILADNEDNV